MRKWVHPAALAEASSLENFSLLFQLLEAVLQLLLNVPNRGAQFVLSGDEVFGGVNVGFEALDQQFAGERIDFDNPLDLVSEEFDPECNVLVGREDFEGVSPHAKRAAHERHVIAVVLDINQLADNLVAPCGLAPAQ